MRVLIAEDDSFFQKLLKQILAPDHELIIASDGAEAWEVLQRPDPPRLAILDWVMPGLSGPEICRNVRACGSLSSMYLILLTAKNNEADIVSGLRAGADDYITKPPMSAELIARVRAGERILALQDAVAAQTKTRDQVLRRETRRRRSQAVRKKDLRGPEHSPLQPVPAGSSRDEETIGIAGHSLHECRENSHSHH